MYGFISRNKVKAAFSSVLCLILVFGLVLTTVPAKPVSADDTSAKPAKKTLNVTGQGIVKVSPDIAYITLGVVTENENARVAQQKNAEIMDRVTSSVKDAGISERDIKTVNYNINPKYNYIKDSGENRIVGYMVNNSIQLTVRDISKTAAIIDTATGSGANMSSNVSFAASDYDKYYKDALKSAIENGKGKAQTMAEALGITINAPSTVTENPVNSIPVYGMGMASGAKYDAAYSTPISSGAIEIRANVSISYEY